MTTTTQIGMTELEAQQASAEVTFNEAIRKLDAHVHLSVKDRTSTPPGGPSEGDRYLLGASPTGAWSTFAQHDIAAYLGSAWVAFTPVEGWKVYVDDEDITLEFDGSSWLMHAALNSGLTANAGGGQGSATQLNAGMNVVATVATTGDSVKLPTAEQGVEVLVANDGANAMDVFPSSSDEIDNAGVNAAVSVGANKSALFRAVSASQWFMLKGA
jgi:hypothetical protein